MHFEVHCVEKSRRPINNQTIIVDELRDPKNRPFVAAGVAALVILFFMWCILSYQFVIFLLKPKPEPAFLAPTVAAIVELAPTQQAQIVVTAPPTQPAPQKIEPSPTAVVEAKGNAAITGGESCVFSSPWLNTIFDPVPSGSWSPIEHYFCNNGYWDIGNHDSVIRKTGNWGYDGIEEKILIKYDRSGNIIDRIYIDPDGQQFPGPSH